MIDLTYKVFHIDGFGESSELRKKLSSKIDDYLEDFFPRLDTETVLISNKEQYDLFNMHHLTLKPKTEFKWGEIGVWASNLLAMQNFLKTDHDYLMLMEDDIQFDLLMVPHLYMHMKTLPKDWDVFSYYVHPNQFSRYTGTDITQMVVPAYQDWSMLCYIVTRNMAEKMLAEVKNGFDEPIDWHIFRHPERYKVYTLAPTAFHPIELYETKSTFQQNEDRISIDKEGV